MIPRAQSLLIDDASLSNNTMRSQCVVQLFVHHLLLPLFLTCICLKHRDETLPSLRHRTSKLYAAIPGDEIFRSPLWTASRQNNLSVRQEGFEVAQICPTVRSTHACNEGLCHQDRCTLGAVQLLRTQRMTAGGSNADEPVVVAIHLLTLHCHVVTRPRLSFLACKNRKGHHNVHFYGEVRVATMSWIVAEFSRFTMTDTPSKMASALRLRPSSILLFLW